ncbi:hypothetical protein M5K25_007542 [Dendrobium thyrsiflorum]|uniref:Uncharacterized protein n=1 Tax=Dendrobium thyrsiflorum TaxID=117978 RepID=A0ABD0VFG2_DENTH
MFSYKTSNQTSRKDEPNDTKFNSIRDKWVQIEDSKRLRKSNRAARRDDSNEPKIINSDIIKIFKCLVNDSQSRRSTSTVQSKHSQLTLELPLFTGHTTLKKL